MCRTSRGSVRLCETGSAPPPPPDDLAPQRTLKHNDSQTCPQTQGQKHRVGGSLAPCPRVHLSTQGTARADRTSSSSHHTEGHLASENSGQMPLSLGRPFRWQPPLQRSLSPQVTGSRQWSWVEIEQSGRPQDPCPCLMLWSLCP